MFQDLSLKPNVFQTQVTQVPLALKIFCKLSHGVLEGLAALEAYWDLQAHAVV